MQSFHLEVALSRILRGLDGGPTIPLTALSLVLGAVCACRGSPPAQEAAPEPLVESRAPKTEVLAVSLRDVGLDPDALDRSIDPCQDFYAFACGGWLEKTSIPSDRSRWVRSFSEIHERNEQDLRAIVEAAAAETGGDDPVVEKIGAYYGACMDEEAVEKAGLSPLKPMLRAIDGVRGVRSLPSVLARLHRLRVWAFFDLTPTQDFGDATQVIGYLDQNGLGLPERDYYLNDSDPKKRALREAYQAHVARLLALSGYPEARARQAAAGILRVETALAEVSKSPVERRDPKGMYNKVDLEGVTEAAPQFAWSKYLEALGAAELTDINVTAPKFVEGLNRLWVEVRPFVLRSYLRWHLLRTYAPSLNAAYFDESFAFTQALTGQDEPRPRWKRCVESTDRALGEFLAQPYVHMRFAGESKSAAEAYVRGISRAFDENLNALGWMDEPTKTRAREKLKKFTYLIGYPEDWRAYDFEVGPVYAANRLSAATFETGRELARIGRPVDRQRWEMTPPTVNAYYHPLKNQMVFPAGILQPPFYDVQAHVPVNLGAMGMVVGHELTHGFDDQGSQFDGDGNLNSWWTPGSRSEFEAKTACVVEQYNAYEALEGVPLNGRLTLGENIADLGGLKLAYAAYRSLQEGRLQEGSGQEEGALGDAPQEVKVADGFSEDQQFFISNAQVWCAKAKDAEMRRRAQVDPHADPRHRVNGPMSNLQEFADAFECPVGSPMRPEKTCAVW